MRAFLEYLGIFAPDRSRKEPVAVPAWVPRAARITFALIALGFAAALWAAVRALF